ESAEKTPVPNKRYKRPRCSRRPCPGLGPSEQALQRFTDLVFSAEQAGTTALVGLKRRRSLKGDLNGNRSKSVASRSRRHPRLGSQRRHRQRQRGRNRLDPDDRRSGGPCALDDLLVKLGGPRLLVAPP